jgi:hypothetical protein
MMRGHHESALPRAQMANSRGHSQRPRVTESLDHRRICLPRSRWRSHSQAPDTSMAGSSPCSRSVGLHKSGWPRPGTAFGHSRIGSRRAELRPTVLIDRRRLGRCHPMRGRRRGPRQPRGRQVHPAVDDVDTRSPFGLRVSSGWLRPPSGKSMAFVPPSPFSRGKRRGALHAKGKVMANASHRWALDFGRANRSPVIVIGRIVCEASYEGARSCVRETCVGALRGIEATSLVLARVVTDDARP